MSSIEQPRKVPDPKTDLPKALPKEKEIEDSRSGTPQKFQAIDMIALETEAGISRKDFSHPTRLLAMEYREIIWSLASSFSQGRCEMTHSECMIDQETGEVKNISLCLDLFDPETELPFVDRSKDQCKARYNSFKDYILQHEKMIPIELRRIDVYIGFNYGETGTITISSNTGAYDPTADFLKIESNDRVGYGDYSGMRNKLECLYERIDLEIVTRLS